MLKIQRSSDACVTTLRLSGRIQSDGLAHIRQIFNSGCARRILDLDEVTLVDIGGIQFLIDCEDEGIELTRCPLWVREWMIRERIEGE